MAAVAVRVPQSGADSRCHAVNQSAKKHGRTPSQHRWSIGDGTILVTNVPNDTLTWQESLVWYRARWQNELRFTVGKDRGRVDESPSTKPWAVFCEGYARFLAMIMQHWGVLTSLWAYPARSLGKASAVVPSHAMSLAAAMEAPHQLVRALVLRARSLLAGCRVNRRKTKPNTYPLP